MKRSQKDFFSNNFLDYLIFGDLKTDITVENSIWILLTTTILSLVKVLAQERETREQNPRNQRVLSKQYLSS